jgi:hypothetical protein
MRKMHKKQLPLVEPAPPTPRHKNGSRLVKYLIETLSYTKKRYKI